MSSDIGLIGLAVMGQNLVLNMRDHGFRVSVYNRSYEKARQFIEAQDSAEGISAHEDLASLCQSLASPRRVMLMVKAGQPVDDTIELLLPHLDKGDIIIDGGNSHFPDSNRRCKYLQEKGLRYVAAGVSGGEVGARFGPSIMPGGDEQAWPHIKELFQAIAAKVDDVPCCDWIGGDGSGHFVKMVHNGIEYGDMQLIAEAYDLLTRGCGLSADEAAAVFAEWNQGVLDSYLIEITAAILARKDEDGSPLVDKILDQAGQKGTGKWTAVDALDQGVPLTLITEAVFSRALSAQKNIRVQAADALGERQKPDSADHTTITAIRDALYAAKIISYTQGFMLLAEAQKNYGWHLKPGPIALMWRDGCIIRSVFLQDIFKAYEKQPQLQNLLLDEFFIQAIKSAENGWRDTIKLAVDCGVPTPAMSSALAFYDGLRSSRLPANLLQAQRDYFGAHQYQRIDRPADEFFHTDWSGLDSQATSGQYDA